MLWPTTSRGGDVELWLETALERMRDAWASSVQLRRVRVHPAENHDDSLHLAIHTIILYQILSEKISPFLSMITSA